MADIASAAGRICELFGITVTAALRYLPASDLDDDGLGSGPA